MIYCLLLLSWIYIARDAQALGEHQRSLLQVRALHDRSLSAFKSFFIRPHQDSIHGKRLEIMAIRLRDVRYVVPLPVDNGKGAKNHAYDHMFALPEVFSALWDTNINPVLGGALPPLRVCIMQASSPCTSSCSALKGFFHAPA